MLQLKVAVSDTTNKTLDYISVSVMDFIVQVLLQLEREREKRERERPGEIERERERTDICTGRVATIAIVAPEHSTQELEKKCSAFRGRCGAHKSGRERVAESACGCIR